MLFYIIWNSFLIYMWTTVISTQVILIPRHCRCDLQKCFCFSKIYHFEIIHLWHFDTYCGIFVLNQRFATFIFLSYENMIRPHLPRYIFLHWRITWTIRTNGIAPWSKILRLHVVQACSHFSLGTRELWQNTYYIGVYYVCKHTCILFLIVYM